LIVIIRLVRVMHFCSTKLDRPDKPGDDEKKGDSREGRDR
jgi:hypothetical protein